MRERGAHVFPLWIYYNMKMRESQILDEWELIWGLTFEKFVSGIFVGRVGSFENENHSHLPKRTGGYGSAVRGSARLSAAFCRPFTPWEHKDPAKKNEPYRGTESVTDFYCFLALYAGEC